MITRLHHASTRTALHAPAAGISLTYAELHAIVQSTKPVWGAQRQLVFLRVRNDLATVLALLSLRAAGHAVVLVDAALDAAMLDALVETYRPHVIVGGDDAVGERVALGPVWCRIIRHESDTVMHPLLALCLATSGSTGSPKLVRLSEDAIVTNARSIVEALDIQADDVAITALPLHYTYGFSLLTTHLAAGASIVISAHGVMAPEFWSDVTTYQVTALAGVPYTYQMLDRLRFARVIPPCVRVMTESGGKLPEDLVRRVHAFMQERGGRFYLMYGQTEATSRLAVLPFDRLPDHLDSVGRAVPGGSFVAVDESGAPLPHGTPGEIVYRGPNVMLGYATCREDLAQGDLLGGVLRTGDLGTVDSEGLVRLTGRIKRIGKLYGVRVDLDAVERLAADMAPVAVLEGDNRLIVFASGEPELDVHTLRTTLATRLRMQQRMIDVRRVAALPRTASGKVDYPALQAAA